MGLLRFKDRCHIFLAACLAISNASKNVRLCTTHTWYAHDGISFKNAQFKPVLAIYTNPHPLGRPLHIKH